MLMTLLILLQQP